MTFFAPHDIIIKLILILVLALVAQLDRVTGYEPVGRGFESLQARQPPHAKRGGFSCFPIRLRLLGEGQSLSFTPFPMGSLHRKLLFCLTSYLFLFYLYSSSTPSAPNPHAKRGGFLAFQSGSAFLGRDSRCPSPPFLWEVCTANFYRPACFQYQKSTQKCGFLLTSRTKYRRFFFSRRAKTPRKIWGFFPFKR